MHNLDIINLLMAPDDDATNKQLPIKKDRVVTPLHSDIKPETGKDEAVEFIRNKIAHLYEKEPGAREEISESKAIHGHRSKHQEFMYNLSRSGKSLAEIQTAWHNYYTALPDNEKHQVWQEFYANHGTSYNPLSAGSSHDVQSVSAQHKPHHALTQPASHHDNRSSGDVRSQLLKRVGSSKKRRSSHAHSLLFGLAMGSIVMVIMLFGFFNERFIAPFISPSRSVSSTPIILDSSAAVGKESKIIIPKINVEIPVIYDEDSTEESEFQTALERGVVHYATTPEPGEKGNAAIFGHSSNNILNRGKYKFAFVLLSRLENGDTFIIEKGGKRYIYKIFDKKIVKPTDVGVLGSTARTATVSLITCDPPGTSLNRLVVVGEQITPDPIKNVASSVKQGTANQPTTLPSNAPSLWSRFVRWVNS